MKTMRKVFATLLALAFAGASPAHAEWVTVWSASGDAGGGPGSRATGLDSFPYWHDYGTASVDNDAPFMVQGIGPGDVMRIGEVGVAMPAFGETFTTQILGPIPEQPTTYFYGTVDMTATGVQWMEPVEILGTRAAFIDVTLSGDGLRGANFETLSGMAFPDPPTPAYRKLDPEAYQQCVATCAVTKTLAMDQCAIHEATAVAGGNIGAIISTGVVGASATLLSGANLVVGVGAAVATYNGIQSGFKDLAGAYAKVCAAVAAAANTNCLTGKCHV